ncbi:MAG: hypothetical protein JSR78_06555 [Proteobacteria bacterium]|nr:hypothetical protein [Pseudomonadota bacterium]
MSKGAGRVMRELRVIFETEPGWHLVPDLAVRIYDIPPKRLSRDNEHRGIREALDRLTPELNLKRERIGRPQHRGSCYAYKKIK